jgi:hypothetical protein
MSEDASVPVDALPEKSWSPSSEEKAAKAPASSGIAAWLDESPSWLEESSSGVPKCPMRPPPL